jgi:bifunctional DNase/RNase
VKFVSSGSASNHQSQPVLLLRESNGDRYLPIWIGQSEAAAIALEQQGVEPPGR